MRAITTAMLIAVLAFLAEWIAPWWAAALIAALIGYYCGLRPGKAFLAGFAGLALMWLIVFLWRDIPNHHILSQRMAKLFSLPSYTLYLVVTILIGGLIGGLSSWSTALLRGIKAN